MRRSGISSSMSLEISRSVSGFGPERGWAAPRRSLGPPSWWAVAVADVLTTRCGGRVRIPRSNLFQPWPARRIAEAMRRIVVPCCALLAQPARGVLGFGRRLELVAVALDDQTCFVADEFPERRASSAPGTGRVSSR